MTKWLVNHINKCDNTVNEAIIEGDLNASQALAEYLEIPADEYQEFLSTYKLSINEFGGTVGGFNVFFEDEVFIVTGLTLLK